MTSVLCFFGGDVGTATLAFDAERKKDALERPRLSPGDDSNSTGTLWRRAVMRPSRVRQTGLDVVSTALSMSLCPWVPARRRSWGHTPRMKTDLERIELSLIC